MDCPTPSKGYFDTREQAKAQIKRLAAPMKGQPKPYRCVCGGWHLTTMTGRDSKRSAKRRRARAT